MPARRSEIARLRDVLHAPGSTYARDVDTLMAIAAALYDGLVEARLTVPELTLAGKLIFARTPWTRVPNHLRLRFVAVAEAMLAAFARRLETSKDERAAA